MLAAPPSSAPSAETVLALSFGNKIGGGILTHSGFGTDLAAKFNIILI